MTLGQVGALFDGDRRYHDPRPAAAPAADSGTFTDLALFASMKVS